MSVWRPSIVERSGERKKWVASTGGYSKKDDFGRIMEKRPKRKGGFSATIQPSYESHLVPVAYGIYRKQY
jgi:hypothetical protein